MCAVTSSIGAIDIDHKTLITSIKVPAASTLELFYTAKTRNHCLRKRARITARQIKLAG